MTQKRDQPSGYKLYKGPNQYFPYIDNDLKTHKLFNKLLVKRVTLLAKIFFLFCLSCFDSDLSPRGRG